MTTHMTGKTGAKCASLSVRLISHLHIKDSAERHCTFVLGRDKENEKKLRGAYTSFLDKYFLFFCKFAIFPQKKKLHYVSNTARVG